MKILVVGDWHSKVHEAPASHALMSLGHDVRPFKWHPYFECRTAHGGARFIESILKRIENKFFVGPDIQRLNTDLIKTVREDQPDLLFIYRGTHILPTTLKIIRERHPGCTVIGYNNDNPFSPKYPKWFWRHFMKSVPFYDVIAAYRPANLEDFKRAGAHRSILLRSWYVPEVHHPVILNEEELALFKNDVVFIGHYEADGREACLEALVDGGIDVKVIGHGKLWNPVLKKNKKLQKLAPVRTLWDDDYNKAINGADIALCFLSKLNQDTYTRRCFEIPAAKTLMLSEYSQDLASMFTPGLEADFFSNKYELAEKADYYLKNPEKRNKVASAGYDRVSRDGHDVVSRMRSLLIDIHDLTHRKTGE